MSRQSNTGNTLNTPQASQSKRRTSIVDILSAPPALGESGEAEEISVPYVTLLRNASSASSVVSSITKGATDQNDWQNVSLTELVEESKLIFINGDISIEEAFKRLDSHNLTSLPVEEFENDLGCITFDYSDLNTYLLLVLHKIDIDQSELELDPHFHLEKSPAQLITDIKQGKQVPVKFVCQLTNKNPFIKLNEKMDTLLMVVEILGSGVHRVAIVSNENKITGILSQRRLIRYLWDNARRFSSLDKLWQTPIDELGIGSSNVIFVYGDHPLIEALLLMSNDHISSVAVVDRQQNLLGNISITDVKHVTKSSQLYLLHKSCLHFVSVILNSRGLEDGQDSFPVFHVFPNTSLGRTIAKLVATKAHRLWIVKPRTTGSFSSPTKPALTSNDSSSSDLSVPVGGLVNLKPEVDGRGSSKLIGVISLTDILGLLASKQGNKFIDPNAARKQRRRSSSSASSKSSKSLEQFRKLSSDKFDR